MAEYATAGLQYVGCEDCRILGKWQNTEQQTGSILDVRIVEW
jgi:hypothetical protein